MNKELFPYQKSTFLSYSNSRELEYSGEKKYDRIKKK